jgi:tetratricopeptide (TPR) repeat protein
MPSPRLVAGAQPEGAQTTRTASRQLGGKIEDALEKGNPDTARMLVPKFLAEPNVTADTLLRIGVDLAQHELFPEAADVFERCVKDHPALFEGYYNLALAELALRKYPAALATIEKAPRASRPQEVACTYLHGKIELALGQDAQAEQNLAAAFAAAPEEEDYALDLGLAYIRARKYQPAVEVFEKAHNFQKDSPFLLLGLSLAQFLGGQNAESAETCHTVLSLHPDFSPARVLLAFALSMQGNVDEAAKVAAQGLRDPDPFPYLYYIHAAALVKQQSKDYDVILKDLTLAERSIPGCSLCYLAQSKAHQKMGERDAATADLEKALELDATLAEAWYRVASLYDQEGRHAEAQRARRRFEELKEDKANRETEMLRGVFLRTLGSKDSP